MNCSMCLDGRSKEACEACKRMQAESDWKWEIDNGCRLIRCPYCDHALVLGAYVYKNWHRFCSYCGKQLIRGEQIGLFEEGNT